MQSSQPVRPDTPDHEPNGSNGFVKGMLKQWTRRVATSRPVGRLVRHLIYPSLMRDLLDEIRADMPSPSGIAESLAWKTHSYIVLEEELRPTGIDCSGPVYSHNEYTRERMFDLLPSANPPEGDILEFGVYRGESLQLFAERFPVRRVYGFDSFDGLPEDWFNRPKGTFKTDVPALSSPNVTLVKGLFDATVPQFLAEWSGKAAIVHVDCTLYASTMACLPQVLPWCQQGTILIFDEYYGYPDFTQHEWRAWRELRHRYGIIAPCLAYDARRVAFQIADLGALPEARA
jgi:macrocin-O-methyltransferase TylF-like protien